VAFVGDIGGDVVVFGTVARAEIEAEGDRGIFPDIFEAHHCVDTEFSFGGVIDLHMISPFGVEIHIAPYNTDREAATEEAVEVVGHFALPHQVRVKLVGNIEDGLIANKVEDRAGIAVASRTVRSLVDQGTEVELERHVFVGVEFVGDTVVGTGDDTEGVTVVLGGEGGDG